MAEVTDIALPEFNGEPLSPERAHELLKVVEHLGNDHIYQEAVGRMAEEAKKDLADLHDPSKRNAAEEKVLAAGGDILMKEIAAVIEHDVHDTNPDHARAYRQFGVTLAALDTLKAAGINTDINVERKKLMTETNNPDDTHAPAATDHAHDTHANDTAPADTHVQTEEEKIRRGEIEKVVGHLMGKGGLVGEARETMIDVIVMIDTMMGGMITKQIHEMEVAAIKEKAAEVASTVEKNKETIAVTALGPVGLVAVVGAETLAPVVEKGVTAISESSVGKMFAHAGHELMQGAQDPVKLAAALKAVSTSVNNANNGQKVILSDTQIPTSAKPVPNNKAPETQQMGANLT